jgi:hypothetical protein
MQVFRPVSRNPQITITREAPSRFVVRDGKTVIATRAFYTSAAVFAVTYTSPAPAVKGLEA